MKFGICNEIFAGWPLEQAMAFAAEAGYDGMELAPFTLAPLVTDISSARRAEIRDMARVAGLEVCGLHWLLAKTDGFHLTHPEAAVRRRTAKYLCDLVDCCADLGGKFLVLGSPQQRNVAAGLSAAQAVEFALDTLGDAVKAAGERGVTWCIEPLGPKETNFLNTAAQAIDFVGQVNSPAARIILDVKAMHSEGGSIPEIIRQSAPHFAHFHANDPNLKGPGFGSLDFRPIAAALKETGYDGYVSVEVFDFEDGAEAIARRSLKYLREVFAST